MHDFSVFVVLFLLRHIKQVTPKFDNRQGQVNIRSQGNGLVMTAVKVIYVAKQNSPKPLKSRRRGDR